MCRLRSRYILLAVRPAAVEGNYSKLVHVPERAAREIDIWAGDLAHFERQPMIRHMRRPDIVLRCKRQRGRGRRRA